MKNYYTLVFCLFSFYSLLPNIVFGQTCSGDITLSTQADVDNFATDYGCNRLNGTLFIRNSSDIVNLDGLSNLQYISGSLLIGNNPMLSNLDGLNNIDTVDFAVNIESCPLVTNVDGLSNLIYTNILIARSNDNLENVDGFLGLENLMGSLEIKDNPNLISIEGLSNFQSIGQSLTISNNSQLSDCCPIFDLINTTGSVAGTITIENNQTGCDSPTEVNCVDPCSMDITLSSQADVDNFATNFGCSRINGILYIQGADIVNLDGLSDLEYISRFLLLGVNPLLSNIDGLNNLDTVGQAIQINSCASLQNIDGLSNLKYTEFVQITKNNNLENVDGLSGLQNLILANGFSGALDISDNPNLTSIEGVANLQTISDGLAIRNNPLLSDCCPIFDIINSSTPPSLIIIENNQTGCDSPAEVNCSIDADGDGFDETVDCNDMNNMIFPGATEICDNIDNNCDGNIDEGLFCYCDAMGNSTQYEWIRKVRLEEINNLSGDNNGYADFTNLSATVERDSSYRIRLRPGFSGISYTEHWRVWIDWNQDGDFDDAGEKVAQGKKSGKLKRKFTVPSNALLGTTMMRVAMKYGGFATPCETFDYGEVEDYNIEIVAPSQSQISIINNSIKSNEKKVNDLQTRNEVQLYPNPVSNMIRLELKNTGEYPSIIEIYNSLGQKISTLKTTNQKVNIDVSQFKQGVYTLTVRRKDLEIIISKPFIKLLN